MSPDDIPTLSALYADRLNVTQMGAFLTQDAKTSASLFPTPTRYWSTPERPNTSGVHEVLEVGFTVEHLVNHVSFETARFPHIVSLERYDAHLGTWLPVPLADGHAAEHPVTESTPGALVSLVDQPDIRAHPQHSWANHWEEVIFLTQPISAQRWRLVLVRIVDATPPVDATGAAVDYSLAIRNLTIGYRVFRQGDMPLPDIITQETTFSSATDLLGSRVQFAGRRQRAQDILRGGIWRSEPQPVGMAVVNFYADTRDASGQGQVIDRFWLDPLTPGPQCNLYYANDEVSGSFTAADDPLIYPAVQQFGTSATWHKLPQDPSDDWLGFSAFFPSYFDIDNAAIQFDPIQPWWIGLQLKPWTWASDDMEGSAGTGATDHPIFDFGAITLRFEQDLVRVVVGAGDGLTLGTATFGVGSQYTFPTLAKLQLVVAYLPDDGVDYDAGVHLWFRIGDAGEVFHVTQAIGLPLSERPPTLRWGGYLGGSPGYGAHYLQAMALKQTEATIDQVETFFADPRSYVKKAPFAHEDTGTTADSLVRFHPDYIIPDAPTGLVGGPGDHYAELTWTPLHLDFTLQRGHLQLPPVRARYWKFEFTNLVPEPYESFLPIIRTVKMFKAELVQRHAELVVPKRMASSPLTDIPGGQRAGIIASQRLGQELRYADALGLVTDRVPSNKFGPTEALAALDPVLAQRMQATWWAYGFQPWHIGITAPRFVTRQRHVYDEITVQHTTKTAFFVGLKQLLAYRLDYTVDADTDQYREHFHDDVNLASTTWELSDQRLSTPAGPINEPAFAEAVSKALTSFRNVAGVQFASVQTDAVQVLPDNDFTDPTLSVWATYGDAGLSSMITGTNAGVQIARVSLPQAYGDLEFLYPTYDDLEAAGTYGDIEGISSGASTVGGVRSQLISPPAGGVLHAAARVIAPANLNGPVWVQIVAADGTVLAESQADVRDGETREWWTSYTLGSVSKPRTYGDIELAGSPGVNTAELQAPTSEAHATTGDYLRGIGVSAAELGEGAGGYSNSAPGAYGTDWYTEPEETFAYLYAHGVRLVRLPFRLERMFLGGVASTTLDATNWGHYRNMVDDALAAGLKVVVEPHNFGGYILSGGEQKVGSGGYSTAQFAAHWGALAGDLKLVPDLIYGLMHKPTGVSAGTWQTASQAAVTAIRATGDTHQILVPGVAPVGTWTANHASPWITDPSDNSRYVTWHWFDAAGTGAYAQTYAQEVADAVTAGYTAGANPDALHTKVATELAVFTAWLTTNTQRGMVSEYGWPNSADQTAWNALGNFWLNKADVAKLWASQWATGAHLGTSNKLAVYEHGAATGTYGDLEAGTYGDLESSALTGPVQVRLVQKGASTDTFLVDTLSLFEDPIVWEFSNDGGVRWWPGLDIRNNPSGVLMFPDRGTNQLQWRVRGYRKGLAISAVHLRPWYGGLLGAIAVRHGLVQAGPNRNLADHYGPVATDPMWRSWDRPIPRGWFAATRQLDPSFGTSFVPMDPVHEVVGTGFLEPPPSDQ